MTISFNSIFCILCLVNNTGSHLLGFVTFAIVDKAGCSLVMSQ